ncbi:MAG: ribosome biogenesis GTP-binding protein YihA/YsxC [Paludibacteraceae bacterium]|nr:ribosome biogenesis GTP-binding protein YihA/YsxC [Paludibacteraceae bacterium]
MQITKSEYIISSADVEKCPQHQLPEYAFIGRSNVGKSSLINMLTHHAGLAKTSQKPGKTLTINSFLITSQSGHSPKNVSEQWHLVDLPGYGYARAGMVQRDALKTMIERYCLYRPQLISLFVLVDSRHEPQKIDLEFMEWCGENEVPFAIIFTKADKLGSGRIKMNVNAYKQVLMETWEELPPIFVTSAEDGTGAEEVLQYIEEINTNLKDEL